MLKKDTQEEHNVVTEADFGLQMLQLWAKEPRDQRPPSEAGKRPGRTLPRDSEGAEPW